MRKLLPYILVITQPGNDIEDGVEDREADGVVWLAGVEDGAEDCEGEGEFGGGQGPGEGLADGLEVAVYGGGLAEEVDEEVVAGDEF